MSTVLPPILAYPDYSRQIRMQASVRPIATGQLWQRAGDCLNQKGNTVSLGRSCHICQAFRPFLVGHRFTLRPDHSSLTWLVNFKLPEGPLARWLEQLQKYDFTTVHCEGKKHSNADALSRNVCKQCGRSHQPPDSPAAVVLLFSDENMATLQLEEPVIGLVLQAKNKNKQPTVDNMSSYSRHTRRLFQIWEQLVVIDNKLYCRFLHQSTNMTDRTLMLLRGARLTRRVFRWAHNLVMIA